MLGQEDTSHLSAKSVIKTVALSKLTHVFMNLPDPNETFLDDLNKLWGVFFIFFIFAGRKKR